VLVSETADLLLVNELITGFSSSLLTIVIVSVSVDVFPAVSVTVTVNVSLVVP
jgi:hypothetical protein